MEKEYIARLFDKELEFYLKSVGAVQIVGPKWCGKSRTAKRYAATTIDLMKKSVRDQFAAIARQSPEVLLDYGQKPLLIDEWQIISYIWNSLKEKIDENGTFGQYILTGSVTDATVDKCLYGQENERHTGTGRIIKKLMRTMSSFESGDSNGAVSIENLKNGIFRPAICNKTLHDYSFLICRGGWPLSIGEEKSIALQQVKTFFSGLVNEDIFSLSDISLKKDVNRAKKILRSYSRCISSESSNETIREDVRSGGDELDKDTFKKYILALERLYVVEELESWNPNLRSKTAIRTKNTRHFVDPSIATAALNLSEDNMFLDMNTFGLLFESLVIRDLRVYCDAIGANVYHYRDKAEREADAVIVFDDESWALVEVKLCNKEDIQEASRKLVELSNDIDDKRHPKPSFLMVVTATQTAYVDDNGVYIVPIGCLRN